MRRTRRRFPASLRWRLTAWVALVLALSLAVVLAVGYNVTGSRLRGQIDQDIAGDAAQFSQALRQQPGTGPGAVAVAADRYVRAQPYSAVAKLLFVLIPGGAPVSNHPELFAFPAAEGGETPGQQAAENAQARRLLTPQLGFSIQRVPDVGPMRILERRVQVGGVNAVIGAGEPLELVERAQHGVAISILIAGAVTLAVVLLVSYFAAGRVAAPLRRLAAVAARVDAGDLQPRMQSSDRSGGELAVLAEAFNHMLDRLERAFAAQRDFVADASHELRTPLTVIRGQLEVLAAQSDPPADEVRRIEKLVQAEVTRMSRLVEDLLLLTRAERTDFLRLETFSLQPFVTELWDGLSLIADRRFELSDVPQGRLQADPDRLAQALRNLARNAIDHTRAPDGLVRLEVRQLGRDEIAFAMVDDGPGIPATERERVFERFRRLDAARGRSAGGAGLGLAIVRAIALAHHGRAVATDPGAGLGARIELILPGYRPGSPREMVGVASRETSDPDA